MNSKKLMKIYVWLSIINNMSYILYLRLLQVFKTVEQIYEISKNKNKFKEILIQNNIILSNNLISELTNFNLKEKSIKIYNNLINQNINIIPIENNLYSKKILQMYNPPLCIFLYGNISKINEKCVYLYKEEFTSYGKRVYEKIYLYLQEKNINLYRKDIFINYEQIYDETFILKYGKNKKNSIDKLYILMPIKNIEYIKEFLVSICDICIIPQARFDEKKYLKTLVEIFLEQSKSILVAPGKIYDYGSYFSNYLIKEGADILLNNYDIQKYL